MEAEPAAVDRLPRQFIARLGDDNPAVRRGAALALGATPKPLLEACPLSLVVHSLVTATKPEAVASKRDAEARRNAVEALASVVSTVGLRLHAASGLSEGEAREVFDALIGASSDYATDNRGDVGSWVRCAAVGSLLSFVSVAVRQPALQLLSGADPDATPAPPFVLPPTDERVRLYLSPDAAAEAVAIISGGPPRAGSPVYVPPRTAVPPDMLASLVQALLRLVGEKLDVVRSTAGSALVRVVHRMDGIAGVPLLQRLRDIVPNDDPSTPAPASDVDDTPAPDLTNWAAAASCFPRLVPLLDLPPYVDSVIAGLVTSVGGLSESVVRCLRPLARVLTPRVTHPNTRACR